MQTYDHVLFSPEDYSNPFLVSTRLRAIRCVIILQQRQGFDEGDPAVGTAGPCNGGGVGVAGRNPEQLPRLSPISGPRFRVDDFRVVVEETEAEIVVTRIAPRGSAYD